MSHFIIEDLRQIPNAMGTGVVWAVPRQRYKTLPEMEHFIAKRTEGDRRSR